MHQRRAEQKGGRAFFLFLNFGPLFQDKGLGPARYEGGLNFLFVLPSFKDYFFISS